MSIRLERHDMNMKKITYSIIILMVAMFSFGCKKQSDDSEVINPFEDNDKIATATPEPTPTEEPATPTPAEVSHEGEMRSLLTGLWVPVEVGTKRPYAIQFNNFKSVSNQWGISQADIVYECIVEGGITRLLGIGENFTSDKIGSVRSARHYFVSIADEYNAIYIHFGGSKYAYNKIKEIGIDEIDGLSGVGDIVFYRDKSIKAPNNAFTSLEKLTKGVQKKGFETSYKEGYSSHFSFYEEDTDLSSEKTANKLKIHFSAYTTPWFEYSAADKQYLAFQFGGPHKDSNTGEQLAFKNIIIQFVKEWDIDKNDYQTMDLEDASGKGLYITNGKMVPITWKKNEKKKWMRYYNEAGEELSINPGKTYIALFPNDRISDVTLE